MGICIRMCCRARGTAITAFLPCTVFFLDSGTGTCYSDRRVLQWIILLARTRCAYTTTRTNVPGTKGFVEESACTSILAVGQSGDIEVVYHKSAHIGLSRWIDVDDPLQEPRRPKNVVSPFKTLMFGGVPPFVVLYLRHPRCHTSKVV